MAESDPLKILLHHDRWATLSMLTACEGLSDGQFHQRFEMGPGSLHDTLTHIIAAARAWTETLAEAESTPRIDADGQRRTPGQLRGLAKSAYDALAAEAHRRAVAGLATRRLRNGQTIQLTRGAILAHVATHGMHHRAQCLNMLRRLGVTPLPPSGVVEWARLAEGKA